MRVILIYAFRELSGAQRAPYLLDSFISSVFAVSEAYRVGDGNVIIKHCCYRNACCSVTVPSFIASAAVVPV